MRTIRLHSTNFTKKVKFNKPRYKLNTKQKNTNSQTGSKLVAINNTSTCTFIK